MDGHNPKDNVDNLDPLDADVEVAQEEHVVLPEMQVYDNASPPSGAFGQMAHWRKRNPRTMALIILTLGIPSTIALLLATPYFIPALAMTSAELFGAACVSATAITGFALREGVFRNGTEERQQWPGVIGVVVNWMRIHPSYAKAIAIPVVMASVAAGVMSGGLLIGVGAAAAYIAALGVGMFAASATAVYVLPKSHVAKEANGLEEKRGIFENVKQFVYEHKFIATVGITIAVGAAVLSGGIALGIGIGAALISSAVVCGTTVSGLYAAQVIVGKAEAKETPVQQSVKAVTPEIEHPQGPKHPVITRRNSAPEILGPNTERVLHNHSGPNKTDIPPH